MHDRIVARASQVFGSEDAALEWLYSPAMALNQQRPVDVLAQPGGDVLVTDLLTRIEYGVYT